jgi:23S rRNA (adenine2030-N6)-methyltransferase
MFSYRHAFHAGNHADVLKHITLVAVLKHLTLKDAALYAIDTHAGAGLYRLDGDYAHTSGEAAQGFVELFAATQAATLAQNKGTALVDSAQAAITKIALPRPEALADYLQLVASFNQASNPTRVYPGSPFILHQLLQGRDRDRIKLFELHPTDAKTLDANVAQLDAGRQISVLREDGFEALKRLLPPPTRRALVLCDPSYELKSDYGRVVDMLTDALQRFATGTYLVWYPIIPRPEAHDLPRKLKTLAQREGRAWLHATLTVKSSKLLTSETGATVRPGLPASGMFVINPPHTLKARLTEALAVVAPLLAQSKNQAFAVEAGGG